MINWNNQVLPYTDFFIAVLVRFPVNCLRLLVVTMIDYLTIAIKTNGFEENFLKSEIRRIFLVR